MMTAQATPSLEERDIFELITPVQMMEACTAYKGACGNMDYDPDGLSAAIESAVRAALKNQANEVSGHD